MKIPNYWLPRPTLGWSPEVAAALDRLYLDRMVPGTGGWIEDTLPVPTWAFLCWLTDDKDLLLHSSGELDIGEFQPRTPHDRSIAGV